MTLADFDPFLEELVASYAREHVRAGRWTEEEALDSSRKEVRELLPAGRETPHHFFFTVLVNDPEEKAGVIWLALEPRGGFIYDLAIFESFRRRGFAEAAMLELEELVRAKGGAKISLHVFGDNFGARKLYSKLGYTETNLVMSKTLS